MRSKIITRVSEKCTKEMATIALQNHLYVSGWSLYGWLKYIQKNGSSFPVSIAYVKDTPVGICMIHKTSNKKYIIATFVDKKYRRNGIGSKLIQSIKNKVQMPIIRIYGETYSLEFFEKNNITHSGWY